MVITVQNSGPTQVRVHVRDGGESKSPGGRPGPDGTPITPGSDPLRQQAGPGTIPKPHSPTPTSVVLGGTPYTKLLSKEDFDQIVVDNSVGDVQEGWGANPSQPGIYQSEGRFYAAVQVGEDKYAVEVRQAGERYEVVKDGSDEGTGVFLKPDADKKLVIDVPADQAPTPKIANPNANQSTAGRLKIIAQAAAGADLSRPLTSAEQQVVDGGFVTKKHLIAIAEASKKGHFAVGFRETGKEALMWLDRGAATKPHSILEKTLKAERVPENLRQGVADSDLQGLAAHWEDGRPVGVFVTRAAAAAWQQHGVPQVRSDNQGNFYVPVDFADPQSRNLAALKSQPGWEKTVITGDYDTHDMVMLTGAGGPHTVVSESSEEAFIRGAINTAVSAVDPDRAGQEHRVVQHGPQVNYPAFAMSKEGLRDKLVPAVAHPSLPVAIVHRGNWKIIRTMDELASFYESIDAKIKVTWQNDEQNTHFANVGDGRVGIRPANYQPS